MPKAETTYVYSNHDGPVEVKMTKRKAKKTIPAIGSAKERHEYLVEITPVNMEDGRWTRFVQMRELDEIYIDGDDE